MSRINKKIEMFCEICNKIFYSIPSIIKKGKVKFCSRKCRIFGLTNSPKSFWTNVDIKENINECWEWKKGKSKSGYGKITYQKKNVRSHKLAYFLTFPEQDIEENKESVVMHVCDNRLCCNPYHLKLGTTQENTQDKVNKKRHSYGEKHGMAKLDEFDVKQILLLKGILKNKTILEMYKITKKILYDIFNNITWKHINRIEYRNF